MPKSLKYWKIGTEIVTKSSKIQGCVADAFLDRFGGGLWALLETPGYSTDVHFGSYFQPKSEKMASKKASKNRCRKSIEKWCQKLPKWWCRNGCPNLGFSFFCERVFFWNSSFFLQDLLAFGRLEGSKKEEQMKKERCQNDAWKIDPKIMTKLCQNGTKMGAKIE